MITSLRLQNFRSYADKSFEFDSGVNVVFGPNASGKTNLLEAILVLARGSSYKSKDIDLIAFKKPWARLDGVFDTGVRTLKLERQTDTVNKNFIIADKPYKRLSLQHTFPVVLFEPNHLQLITRGPDQRRQWLDELLERTTPGFKILSSRYYRALAQRNHLLKRGPAHGASQLFVWDVRLGELGAQIAVARADFIKQINTKLSRSYSQIAQKKSTAKVEYASQFPPDNYASRLVSKLGATATTDFERGFTGHGPHREDILFYLNKQPLLAAASRGETRSLLLVLKILELEQIEKARAQRPIFLLDDVFSELDDSRRKALVEHLSGYQTIITTTDADILPTKLLKSRNRIKLALG